MRVCVETHISRPLYASMLIEACACVYASARMIRHPVITIPLTDPPGMRLCVSAHRVGRGGRVSPGRIAPTLYMGAHAAPLSRCFPDGRNGPRVTVNASNPGTAHGQQAMRPTRRYCLEAIGTGRDCPLSLIS